MESGIEITQKTLQNSNDSQTLADDYDSSNSDCNQSRKPNMNSKQQNINENHTIHDPINNNNYSNIQPNQYMQNFSTPYKTSLPYYTMPPNFNYSYGIYPTLPIYNTSNQPGMQQIPHHYNLNNTYRIKDIQIPNVNSGNNCQNSSNETYKVKKQSNSVPHINTNRNHTINLTLFWQNAPRAWFNYVDNIFENQGIDNDVDKFWSIAVAIPTNARCEIQHLFDNNDVGIALEEMKQILTEMYSESDKEKLNKLFSGLSLGDLKPSHLLRKMRTLSNNKCEDSFLNSMWIKHLPTSVRAAIATIPSETDLNEIAKIADNVYEEVSYSSSVREIKENNECNNLETNRLAKLEQQVTNLTNLLQNSHLNLNHSRSSNRNFNRNYRGRSNSRNRFFLRNRSNSRNRSNFRNQQTNSDKNVCYYHRRFGDRANKCEKPCEYKSNGSENFQTDH